MKLLIWTLAPQPGIAFGVLNVQFHTLKGAFASYMILEGVNGIIQIKC
ncbi:hypothetical protein Hdeb2414_s0012g00388141 [Helianthus debilis subsp. tardiflorus]